MLYQDIVKKVSQYNNSTEKQILEIFKEAGLSSIKKDDKIYKKAGLNPDKLSSSMLQLLSSTAKRTHNNLSNLTLTTANTSQTTFLNSINKAYLEVSTGIKSYSQSILDTIKEISDKGATIQYPSGRNISIESAVRMNILTSVNQNSAKLQEMRAEEMGWDLVEVSAHSGARPEHAEWQGKVYSLKGITKGYKLLSDACGYGSATGLCGINCRHTFFPFYKGSARTYTNKELNKLKNEKVTYNGKEYTVYQATQIQRKLERIVRDNKRQIATLEGILTSNTNDDKLILEAKNKLSVSKIKLNQSNAILNDFLNKTEFKKDFTRTFIGQSNFKYLDIAEPLNKLINEKNQKTTKAINDLIEKYDKNRKLKIDYLCSKPFRYSIDLDKILINPNHNDFEDYNIKESIAHEIFHLIDIQNGISKNSKLNNKIEVLKNILIQKKDELNTLLESNKYKNDIFLSDLFAGITKNEIFGFCAHEINYWNNEQNRLCEIFSNIETIHLTKDKKALRLINSFPEFKIIFKEVVKLYDKFI